MTSADVIACAQVLAAIAAGGSSLLIAITIRRWVASLEIKVSRIDSLLDRIEDRRT